MIFEQISKNPGAGAGTRQPLFFCTFPVNTLPYLLVWDLDGTLGDFYALEKHPDGRQPVTVQVRSGLAEALARLSAAGFVHTLLTVASRSYAEIVLRGVGIRELFARVEGRGERPKGDAVGIGQTFGLRESHLPERVLFIGDRVAFDEPEDPRVVFHFEPWALTRSAAALAELLIQLRALGQGSLRGGFDHLLDDRRWWQRWKRAKLPYDSPLIRQLPGLEEVALVLRQKACPIIGFPTAPRPQAPADYVSFIPDEKFPPARGTTATR